MKESNYYLFDKNYIFESKYDFYETILKKINTSIVDEILINKDSINYFYIPKQKKLHFNFDKKTILIIIHELSRTGAPMVALDTAKILKDRGYFTTVITLKDGPLRQELTNFGIPVIVLKDLGIIQYTNSEFEMFNNNLDLDNFIKYFDKIIVITATLYNIIKRYMNTNKEIIWWIHEGSESYQILAGKMPKMISPNIKVYCGGEYSLNQLKNYGYKYFPSVLNYGVHDVVKNKLNFNEELVFLMAGTISKRKGQSIMLKALKLMDRRIMKQAKFIFIGDAYESDYEGLEIKKELISFSKKNDNVLVLASIPREELFKLYDNIDVLVLASIDDPMPVVATESFMKEKIVICSTETGTSYYVKDKKNGFVFKSGDSEELLEKLVYIIKNKDKLDVIAKEGRKIFENIFEMSKFEEKLLKIMED